MFKQFQPNSRLQPLQRKPVQHSDEMFHDVVPSLAGVCAHIEIEQLPDFMVVEVPAWVDGKGVAGIQLDAMPQGFGGLLANQVAVHDLTAQAIIEGSKDLAAQALLVDPVVDRVAAVEPLIDTMVELQSDYLGYLR